MSGTVTVLDSKHVYQGAIFGVDDMRIALPMRDGGQTVIRRQVMRHAPCVVMLVHDCANDRYLIEREYRVGCDAFAYGLPAGLIDGGEDAEQAALRELREETGVEPTGHDGIEFDHVGQFYSSEGMTDELANIMVLHLRSWAPRRTSLRRRRACRIGVGFLAAAARRSHHRIQFHDCHSSRANSAKPAKYSQKFFRIVKIIAE